MTAEATFKVAYADPETGEGSAVAAAHILNMANMLAQKDPARTEAILMAAAAMSGCLNGQDDNRIVEVMRISIPNARVIINKVLAEARDGTRAH